MKKNIEPWIESVRKVVESHKLGTGAYARWIMEGDEKRQMGINEYGCADAANILYTIGDFPRDVEERKEWVRILQDMQDPGTGLFTEATHHTVHTTAHCLAALELFDALPKYRLTAYDPYRTKEGLYRFFDEQPWKASPWLASHIWAGLYAAMNVAEEATPEWNQWYFDRMWEESDPVTGLWRKGCIEGSPKPLYQHMAGTFHYLFNHEHAKMPLHYPDKMIDTCIAMYREHAMDVHNFAKMVGFVEIDWVYCITRALRQCNHRFEECVEVITEFADAYLDFLLSQDPYTSKEMDDLHMVFGALCCVAELQRFLPGCVLTDKPLKLVLDRRPFI